MIAYLEKHIFRLTWALNLVTVFALMVVMILTCTDVVGRLFRHPILGVYELTEYIFVVLSACALAYTQVRRGNIAVYFAVSKLPQRGQAVVSSITGLLSLGLFIVLCWRMFSYARFLQLQGQLSTVLLIPKFPFVYLLGTAFVFLSMVLFLDLLKSLAKAVRK